ncbi:MAG TPA: hypothetical protein ENN97_02910 [Phycisphaerales bacterium]|nr:hypothetical protein [Phycisphaerales bacterium]
MLKEIGQHNTTIHAIFRPADVVRDVLRDYAANRGCRLTCYSDLWETVSRMPFTHHDHTTIITARPERLTPEGIAVLEGFIESTNLVFILWLENGPSFSTIKRHFGKQNLYVSDNICQFDDILKNLEKSGLFCQNKLEKSKTVRKHPPIRTVSLSDEELNALRGTNR